MYIVALNGSINKDGNCRFLIDTVLNDCKQMGAEVEVINIPEAIMDSKNPFCVQCSSPCQGVCYKGTKLGDAYDKVAKADADMAACATDFSRLQELSMEKEKLEQKLEERMERWMELSELAEEIERNKA